MSGTTGSASAEAVARYGATLFELAVEAGSLEAVEADARAVIAAVDGSAALSDALASPLHPATEKAGVLAALAAKMKLDPLTARFLGVAAANGRAGAVKPMLQQVLTLAAKARGAVIAEVATAQALSDAQLAALKGSLEQAFKAPVSIETSVRPDLIGGLVVKVGSRLFDDSIKTKLDALKIAMKGA